MDKLSLGVLWYIAFLFSMTVHEAAHAWAGYRLGDSTAYRGGQVSLNPYPHVRREPFGTVLAPIITFVIGGWMMGWASAPYDPAWAERYPRRSAWMSLAGPAANLLVVILAGLIIRLGIFFEIFDAPYTASFTRIASAVSDGWHGAAVLVSILFTLNLILFAFNLIPLAPLDGSAAVTLLMSDRMAERYRDIMLNPTFSMLGLIVAWQSFDHLIRPIFHLGLNLLYPGEYS